MKNQKKKIRFYIISIVFILNTILFFCTYLYLENYYKAEKSVNNYLKSREDVKVIPIENGYFFDSIGEEDAIIFYPGAKVEYTSYAPLMFELAKKGVDCFLIKMPFHLALFNINAADNIIDKYKYDNIYLAGHSLGGAMASIYVYDNSEKIEGLILLASYSTKPISPSIKVLSIYGDKDGVLNIKKYNKNKNNWNDNTKEVILQGANHAGFANYGMQKGDNQAEVTNGLQQEQTIDAIIQFMNK